MHVPIPLPGDVVWIRQRRWRVERARREGTTVRLDVQGRDDACTFLAPFDRPATLVRPSRPAHARPQCVVAALAGLAGRTCSHRVPAATIEARLAILGYQLEPTLAVLAGTRRVLIADEVGLGKTIQAGLILAELQRRASRFRALVIVPATLREQWADELRERFSLACELADRAGVDHAGRLSPFGQNAWQRPGIWVASPDYLKQRHVLQGMPCMAWDLLIIDEAHEAGGSTERHAACDEIARRARHVVLLTATPHDGDETRFERVLGLGKLASLPDDLAVFRRTRADVALACTRRVRWCRVKLSGAEVELFDTLIAYERTLLAAPAAHHASTLLLLAIFRKRALSTMHAFRDSLARRMAWLTGAQEPLAPDWLQPQLDFESPSDELAEGDRRALMAETGLTTAREGAWLARLEALAAAAEPHESKLSHIRRLLRRTDEPLVIFTEFRDSLDALVRTVEPLRTVAVLHGAQTLADRRQQLQRFLTGEASALLATDVAGQGLNLQTRARWVMSLELPWNPTRLEQRVGRVDRIGQARQVHFTLLIASHPAEGLLLAALARRALSARQSLGPSVLQDVSPPEPMALAAALIAGLPLSTVRPAGATVAVAPLLCSRYTRTASALGVLLLRKRRLAERWPAKPGRGRPMWTSVRRLPLLRRALPGPCAVVSVPLLNGATGAVIEHHIVVLRGPFDRSRMGSTQIESAALAVASHQLELRRHRLQTALCKAAEVTNVLEAALMRHLQSLIRPHVIQPGLFRLPAGHTPGAQQGATAHAPSGAAGSRSATPGRPPQVQIGRPSLVVLLVP